MKNPWMIAFFALVAWIAISNGWINFGARVDPYSAAAAVGVRNPLPSVGVGDPRRPQAHFGDQSQFVGLLNGPSINQVPPQQGFVDLNQLVAEAAQGSGCDPQALALSAQHLPPNTVRVRLNEASCNFTWWAAN